jgi:uncharacterized membrane protein
MSDGSATEAAIPPAGGLVLYTHSIYGLHALAVLTGFFSNASVTERCVFGLPSLIAVIMNYARRREAYGSFLQSHFNWQIRTFWLALLGLALTLLVSAPLIFLAFLGARTAQAGFGVVGVWMIYRVARGWLALRAGQAMPPRLA